MSGSTFSFTRLRAQFIKEVLSVLRDPRSSMVVFDPARAGSAPTSRYWYAISATLPNSPFPVMITNHCSENAADLASMPAYTDIEDLSGSNSINCAMGTMQISSTWSFKAE